MNCGTGVEREDSYCRHCGESLTQRFGRDDNDRRERARPALGRVDIRPLIVRERHVKVNWLIWPSCAIAAVMALGFVMFSESGHGVFWFVLLALTSLLYKPLNDLRRARFVRLWGVTGLEANASGDVFITELGGACPICGGELTLRIARIGRTEMGRSPFYTLVSCKDYRDHHWHFNPLSLHPLRDDANAAPRESSGPFN